ncbi:uncharacterized protein LOC121200035 isoform X2 [Toxotes jaculatrix]|uniref:uncharacterized protein LOC121200035 isoform X2 n=1 Tax=Toxotes jaculatrix TaxID=941984 RepID=UPI001B3A9498|nr:uncharacterized protein LOC121200035 isoform X2 [Toxotes jaculatrix]
MVEFGWIKISFLLLQITELNGQHSSIVRHGGDVTLSCENVKRNKHNCDSTSWIVTDSRKSAAVELVRLGKIGEHARDKSDRLSVTENCSLVIKKVTDEDAGCYTCRQFDKSGQKQGPDSVVHLSVVTMTEQWSTDKVTLNCSVSTYGRCGHTVKWLLSGNYVDKDNNQMKTSQSDCSANVSFTTSRYIYKSQNFELLECAVKDVHSGKEQRFRFSPPSSGEKPGEDNHTTESATTRTTEKSTTVTTKQTGSPNNDTEKKPQDWWWYIIVAVGLVALMMIVVALVRSKRTKANTTQMDDNTGLTSQTAQTQSAPETRQDLADPEDGVFYTSVSYTRTSDSEARICHKDDEGDVVIYSTVKASSASTGASADPSDLYATINKPNK